MAPLRLAGNKPAHSDLVFSDNGGCHEFWKRRTFVAAGRPVADYYFVGVIHAPLGRRDNGRSTVEVNTPGGARAYEVKKVEWR